MNKSILMGRLTRDPETRYSQGADPIAVSKYSLAVPRKFKRSGEPDVDFINCVAFGKSGEFAQKYFSKGQLVSVVGRIQIDPYTDKQGNKRTSFNIIIEDQYFAESKAANESRKNHDVLDGFYPIDELNDNELPF